MENKIGDKLAYDEVLSAEQTPLDVKMNDREAFSGEEEPDAECRELAQTVRVPN